MAKGLVLAAAKSGSGKTVVTLALARAFRNKGLTVAVAKIGPDYIDGRFHQAASGSPCINLDPWAMGMAHCHARISALGKDVDLVIIEGVMGLYDTAEGQNASTADVADALGLSVILVLDAQGQSQTIAALALGLKQFRPKLTIAGAILNRVASDRHERLIAEAWPRSTVPLLGTLRHNDSLSWPSRHLGLVQAQEIQKLEEFIESAAAGVSRETSLDRILESASEITNQALFNLPLPPLGQHIAIANDMAFAFAYPHLMVDWHKQGAKISYFSPLNNEPPPPDADAVFLPGGYPELHAEKLAANTLFLSGLRDHSGIIYGECGGYMVLGDAIIDAKGQSHAMAGLLPLTTSFARRKLHLGYRQLKPLNSPWNIPLRGHEFHYSTVAAMGKTDPLFHASDTMDRDLGEQGQRVGNVMGSYHHIISRAPA